MDYSTSKLPRPSFKAILIMVALGIIVAAAIYQAQLRGFLPNQGLSFPKSLPSLETRTVVQEENAIISVADKTSPSVVAIGVSKRTINPFDPFASSQPQDSTIGTGFVVDKGVIITNKHVVSDTATVYTVITKDGQKYDTQKIYRDPVLDLAIIQVNGGDGLKPLELGDSSKLKVGQTAIAIGNALGRFTNTVTTGVVSGLGRAVSAGDPYEGSVERLDNLIQTDAAINPGNSGGPLLNSSGQVIGVDVATTEGAQNIGFAIPINAVKPIVSEFLTKGTVSRPYLGVRYRFISKDVALLNDVPQGAYVQDVLNGGPADKAGIQPGDIIVKINGQNVDSENIVSDTVSKAQVGQRMDLVVWRNGKQLTVNATIGESPQQ